MSRSWIALLAMVVVGVGWAADKPAPAAAGSSIQGKVLEATDVESYTYLRLQTRDGEAWAAVARAPIKAGTDVTIEYATVMTDFESRTLNRKFDRIVFGTVAGPGGQPMSRGGDLASMHAGVTKTVDVGDVKVAKATGPGARTVAEVVTRRTDLKDKTVVVRGKVVKFTPEVLGKNWIHLRDGSGSASEGTHDVLVTTRDEAKIGDVVLVKGVVHTDKDLGSGYSYKVLIEEATLQK